MEKAGLKAKLRGGRAPIGIRSQLCSAIVAEALGFAGFDYVYIDMEHAPNDLMSVLHQCQAVAATPAQPVVRLPANDGVLIQQLLDLGVENIVVPAVETADAARRAVRATRYPPEGHRSAARVHRGNRYGADARYNDRIAERICLIVQVESRAAIARVAEIAAVDGVDGVLFGPADLAADFGHLGRPDHPEITEAIRGALAVVADAGKAPGMSTSDLDAGRRWLAAGCRFLSVGGDLQMLAESARRLARSYAELSPPAGPRP